MGGIVTAIAMGMRGVGMRGMDIGMDIMNISVSMNVPEPPQFQAKWEPDKSVHRVHRATVHRVAREYLVHSNAGAG